MCSKYDVNLKLTGIEGDVSKRITGDNTVIMVQN